jgi:flagellar basal-body rod protein FlgF
MDRLIYVAMTGAKQILEQQATVSHNLANVSTSGFRAQYDAFRAVPVVGSPSPTRTFAVDATVGTNFDVGTIQQTGRNLDVAINGKGWLAVERADGSEGYTRAGSLKTDENGQLQTQSGLNVLGDGGPITIPPDVNITIAADGTISSVDAGSKPGTTIQVGRLKLVNPDESTLVRGEDGLFVTNDGQPADADANVTVVPGAVEGSNVNVVDAMVSMISLSRQFEMHMDSLKRAESNDTKAGDILALN